MAQLSNTTINGAILVGCTADCSKVGNIWYNTATCKLQYSACVGTWSSGGNMNVGISELAGAGTQNAGLAFGGSPGPVSCTEEYNGSSWGTGGALITARLRLAGAGTQNAGLAFGGQPGALSCTEEYIKSIDAKDI